MKYLCLRYTCVTLFGKFMLAVKENMCLVFGKLLTQPRGLFFISVFVINENGSTDWC